MSSCSGGGSATPLSPQSSVGGVRLDQCAPDVRSDPVVRRELERLAVFTGWLSTWKVPGYVGEVGWPGRRTGDGTQWNALADCWFTAADAASLWVTVWASGELWSQRYDAGVYLASVPGTGPVDTVEAPGRVLERHRGSASVLRGVNSAGAEFAAPSSSKTSATFSNKQPGLYGTKYKYDSPETFQFLRARGVRLVRLPVRWERLQPTLRGALDATEVARLVTTLRAAAAAGLKVIVDLHNYAGYYRDYRGTGQRLVLGSPELPFTYLADVWVRLVRALDGVPGVLGYDPMNEPTGLVAAGGRSAAQVWEQASQAAVDAIRRAGSRKPVFVEGYGFAATRRWATMHPKPWIRDPLRQVRYQAHQYFDEDSSGRYDRTYAEETARAAASPR